jgi:predicted methyltransferase
MLTSLLQALKPGGVVAVIDHAGDGDKDNPSMHRIDEKVVRDLAKGAGFIVAKSSDMLRNPDDDRTKAVFAPEVRGKTDRFLIVLQKPE